MSQVKRWLRAHDLSACSDTLEPLIQASHLMQSRKNEANLDTLCGEMTSRLWPKQAVAILQHYTPPSGFEEDSIDPAFIMKMRDRLCERAALAQANGSEIVVG